MRILRCDISKTERVCVREQRGRERERAREKGRGREIERGKEIKRDNYHIRMNGYSPVENL